MAAKVRGLYETLITEAVQGELERLEGLHVRRGPLRAAEAGDRLALHLGRLIVRAVESLEEGRRVEVGTALARRVVEVLGGEAAAAVAGETPVEAGGVLRALAQPLPDGSSERIGEPLIPLLDTALLTNAPGEPRVGSQILAEIESADRIDVVMAFIRLSGIRPLLRALERHCAAGRALRVLTTTYTGSTEGRALEALQGLGAQVRVSYDTSGTRLHAKSWLLHRGSGFSTAYIGSSNLTHSAQVTGLEWNVRVSGPRNPAVVEKVEAVFESYWNSGDFIDFRSEDFERASEKKGPIIYLSPVELRPEPFQERLLEQIAISRRRGHDRNLLVAATGTGKTVMAAVDYARLRGELKRSRLLFVAHRAEILTQSLATFRHALRDPSFGELWVGGKRPADYENVFASVQSLSASGLAHLAPDHFDVVIVDEFHHAAAPTYRALLEHLEPKELLGLTATPERSDGLPVLEWFDGRIAAELRLWDAIDQHRLVPFSYYGVHDGVDLREIPWRRGQGYDASGLSNLLTANDAWARLVISKTVELVGDIHEIRALGFCVSVEHARFMARVFREAGIPAAAVWSDSTAAEREAALRDLAAGKLNVLFSVDLFNEGVDVPSVDTLLLLRPTDSPTLFLQQLGRGLRKSPGKSVCTVIDFVGLHRKEFRFDRRLGALLGGTRRELERQVETGFPFLPAGCHMEFDALARETILRSIRESVPSGWTAKVDELRRIVAGAGDCTLAAYLEETGLDLADVYTGGRSWSDLCEAAGLPTERAGPFEAILRRACGRLLHVDDELRLDTWSALLREGPPALQALDARRRRLLRMLVAQLLDQAIKKDTCLEEACASLWEHPQVLSELRELFEVLKEKAEHLHLPLAQRPEVPLRVHGRYTRIEILAAFSQDKGAKIAPWQTGVYWAKESQADLLAFTLDKTSGSFSPTTRYRDYAISRELIHWESQSVTRADSETGMRYQKHATQGSAILLFARLRADERAFWFLGPATYLSHESERPMKITWRLHHPLPGDLFTQFAAAVA